MAGRKKVQMECRLKSWDDVDETLKQTAECDRVMSDLQSDMNVELDAVKTRYAQMAKPVQERLDHYSADVCQYVTLHRGDMEGKTEELNFGRTGFRISTKLKYRKGVKAADVVAVLHRLDLGKCIKTTQKVIAEVLKKQPVGVLDQVGAYIDQKDEFWFETKKENIQTTTEKGDL